MMENGVAPHGTDQEGLRELAERLLLQPYPDLATGIELRPGGMPQDRSATFPLPEGARLLGSAVYRRGREIIRVDAVVDVPAPPAIAGRAYEEQLRQQGWGLFGFHGGGFMPTHSGIPRSFRHHRGGPALLVHEHDLGKGTTSLRLQLDWQIGQNPPPRLHEGMDLLPTLLAPLDVTMDGGGSGGGDSHWSTTATAYTEMSPRNLEAFFADQLSRAGWTRVAGDSAADLAWSTWSVRTSRPWLGLLLVSAFGRHERSLLINLHAPTRHHNRSTTWATLSSRSRLPWWRQLRLRI
jgi:hypothetical protein